MSCVRLFSIKLVQIFGLLRFFCPNNCTATKKSNFYDCLENKKDRCGGLVDRASVPHAVVTWFEYGQCLCHQSIITLACIFKTFSNSKKKKLSFWYVFPDQYEYVNHFFPARPYFRNFYVKRLKTTLNSCF